MKNVGIKYLFAIGLAALAIQACAKKDDALRARKDQAKEAQDKTIADNATAAEKAAAADAAAKAAKNQDGQGVSQTTCSAPGSLSTTGEVEGEGEEKLELEDLMKGGKTIKLEAGIYELDHMEYFLEVQTTGKAGTQNNSLTGYGSTYATPADLKTEVKSTAKDTISCNTSLKSADAKTPGFSFNSGFPIPNVVNLEDGAISVFRTDTVKITNGNMATEAALTAVTTNLKEIATKNPGTEFSYIAQENNNFTIRTRTLNTTKSADGIENKVTTRISATFKKK